MSYKPPSVGAGALRSQLEPVAAKMLEKYGQVAPVSQVHLRARPDSPQEAFRAIQKVILKWMENKAGRALPGPAWDGETFELDEIGAQRAEAVAFENRFWSARVDDADKKVPQRTWATEAAVGWSQEHVLFGVRLFCVSRTTNPPFFRSIPGIVRGALAEVALRLDGRPVTIDPWIVGPGDLSEFVDLLCSQHRIAPICVVSLPEGSGDPSDAILSVDSLASRTLGVAHTVILTGPATYGLTDRVGKEFSVFQGAVRTYNPDFRLEESQPKDHPLAMVPRIQEWRGGPGGFVDMLVNQTLRQSVAGKDLESALPSYNAIRQLVRRAELEALQHSDASDSEQLAKALQEIKALREDLDEWKGLCGVAEAETAESESRVTELEGQIFQLRAYVKSLESRLDASSEISVAEDLPETLDELEDWSSCLAGRVVLHNRALRAAKKSPFVDVSYVYRVLLFLRNRFVPMKRYGGEDGRREAYLEGLKELKLEDTATLSKDAGEYGDTYFVQYGGKRRELEMHLKGNNNRDPRYGFRLYYFWDDDLAQVVVGSLPNHLVTGAT